MKNTPILETIEPGIAESLVNRRQAIAKGAGISSSVAAGLALGAVPLALAALARDAYGQNAPSAVVDVLEFAFLLENLEAEFYKAVVGSSASAAFNTAFATVRATLSATDVATFTRIRDHEIAHVNFLRNAIQTNGRTPATYTAESFDFTGGSGSGSGPFLAATQQRAFLLAAAQAFEDTGVRAYKGQAGNLLASRPTLEAALTIHSVEARHAAKIRKMRNASGVNVPPSGTITLEESGITGLNAAGTAVIAMIYEGEDNLSHVVFNGTAQATVNAAPFGNNFGGNAAVSQAFDEPLTKEQVTAIVTPFLAA